MNPAVYCPPVEIRQEIQSAHVACGVPADVPEPASLAILGITLILAFMVKRVVSGRA